MTSTLTVPARSRRLVFKTTSDPFVGKLSMFRVFRGSMKSNGEIYNVNKNQSERLGQLYLPQGNSQDNVSEVVAGDIGAIGKLGATLTGDTLSASDNRVTLPGIDFPKGFYSLAVVPATQADLDKMSTSLARIVEDDPSLQFTRNPETSESLLTGLGEVQIEVALDRIKRKFGANLNVKLPVVPYRETITQITNSEYRHKKQTGGSGQYGHVLLRLEPKTRDEGFEFGNEVVGGRVPRELIPAVEKGVVNTLKEGVLAGFPVVDLKAVIYDGSTHPVDGKPIAFEIAGSQALRQGMTKASPVLLEPIVRLYTTVPETYTGDIISDINSKRGRILGHDPGEPLHRDRGRGAPGRGAALFPGPALYDRRPRLLPVRVRPLRAGPPEHRATRDRHRQTGQGRGNCVNSSPHHLQTIGRRPMATAAVLLLGVNRACRAMP